MALSVWTERGWVVLASDAIHLYEEGEKERPFAIFHDLQVMIEGYRKLNALAPSPKHLIPGHDPLVTKRFPAAAPDLGGMAVRRALGPDDGPGSSAGRRIASARSEEVGGGTEGVGPLRSRGPLDPKK